MKTILPSSITNVDEAKKFLKELNDNGEAYHPDDNAEDIVDGRTDKMLFTKEEAIQMNKLMEQVCSIEEFDPYSYLLELDDTPSE